jgi:hypothetical protein
VYVAGNGDNAIAIFAQDPRTGVLRQLAGRRGCIAIRGPAGCAAARGLAGVHSLALSPDGRNLYAASELGAAMVTLTLARRTPHRTSSSRYAARE